MPPGSPNRISTASTARRHPLPPPADPPRARRVTWAVSVVRHSERVRRICLANRLHAGSGSGTPVPRRSRSAIGAAPVRYRLKARTAAATAAAGAAALPPGRDDMGSVNKVILVGNLGRDSELRYTPGGAAVATLNLATTEVWNDRNNQRQEKTEWHL